jgi:hypothetical protein
MGKHLMGYVKTPYGLCKTTIATTTTTTPTTTRNFMINTFINLYAMLLFNT